MTNDASIKFSGSFADKFGELHRLDALDVNAALLLQPRHTGPRHFVRRALKCVVIKTTLASRALVCGQNGRLTRFARHTQVNEPNFAGLRVGSLKLELIRQRIATRGRTQNLFFRTVCRDRVAPPEADAGPILSGICRPTASAGRKTVKTKNLVMEDTRNHTSAPMLSAVINLPTPNSNGEASPESLVAQFISSRERLRQREQLLQAELAQIRSALKGLPAPLSPSAAPVPPPPKPSQRTGLDTAVAVVLAFGPLTKEQILEKLRAQAFPLPENPHIALNGVIYTRRFRRDGKLFSVAANAARGREQTSPPIL